MSTSIKLAVEVKVSGRKVEPDLESFQPIGVYTMELRVPLENIIDQRVIDVDDLHRQIGAAVVAAMETQPK